MWSDEAYNNELTDTKRALTLWAERCQGIGHIAIDDDPGYWRIAVEPDQSALCPIELIIRRDRQFDLAVAQSMIEDQPITDFTYFTALFEAVGEGRATIETYWSAATHQWLATRTLVALRDHEHWDRLERTALGERLGIDNAIIETRRFAPYLPHQE